MLGSRSALERPQCLLRAQSGLSNLSRAVVEPRLLALILQVRHARFEKPWSTSMATSFKHSGKDVRKTSAPRRPRKLACFSLGRSLAPILRTLARSSSNEAGASIPHRASVPAISLRHACHSPCLARRRGHIIRKPRVNCIDVFIGAGKSLIFASSAIPSAVMRVTVAKLDER
jgi:hypothetical protein